MSAGRLGRVLAAGAIGLGLLLVPISATAAPSAHEILLRVMGANADTPDLASADVLSKLRIKKPLSDPPDCEFSGTMQFTGGRQTLNIGRRTAGLVCWAVNRYVLGRLFEASEPLQTFFSRFTFQVLGEKLVGTQHFYLLQGRARDPKNNPTGMIGWVDYERGLVTEGTVDFTWGSIDSEQQYGRVNGALVLTHQYLYAPRFDASLEIFYSNFRFAR
ncbi:MAG TPA: hypothetical protein VJT32_02575 [bacterium]|nr:hypothetical protein [bacterium]